MEYILSTLGQMFSGKTGHLALIIVCIMLFGVIWLLVKYFVLPYSKERLEAINSLIGFIPLAKKQTEDFATLESTIRNEVLHKLSSLTTSMNGFGTRMAENELQNQIFQKEALERLSKVEARHDELYNHVHKSRRS